MVTIKNYRMPHNCYDCDLHNYHECNLTSESIEDDYCWNGDSREKHCPLREVEATPKSDYENRLKDDLVAMLVELDLTIDEIPIVTRHGVTGTVMTAQGMRKRIKENIQQKIDELKGEQEAADGKD